MALGLEATVSTEDKSKLSRLNHLMVEIREQANAASLGVDMLLLKDTFPKSLDIESVEATVDAAMKNLRGLIEQELPKQDYLPFRPIVHDLKTPSNFVLGGYDVMKNGGLTEDIKKGYLSLVHDCLYDFSQKLAMVDRYAELEAGSYTPLIEKYAPEDILTRKANLVNRINEATGKEERVSLERGLRKGVYGDVVAFECASTNLIGNALKHGEGEIKVSMDCRDDQAILSVSNDGKRIPDEIYQHLFDRDVHGGSTGSWGVGLWLVKRFAEINGGQTWAERDGTRSTFYFSLPAGHASYSGQPQTER